MVPKLCKLLLDCWEYMILVSRQKLGISVLIKTGPAKKGLPWQQHNRCNFVSFVMYISGAKFEVRHRYSISRDFFYSLFFSFYFDVITFLI